MTISLKALHPLAANVRALIAVDPTSAALVDLKRPVATFTNAAGATISTNSDGVGVLTTSGSDAGNKAGFTFSPPLTGSSQAAGFQGTVLLVSKFVRGDSNLASYKLTLPIGGPGDMIYQPMPTIAQGYGNVACLQSTSGDTYQAANATSLSQVGTVHSLAVTASNPAGGWHSVAGRLFVDGVDSGIAATGDGGDFTISGFNGIANTLWVGDLLYLVFFDRVLTAEEITELSSSVTTTGRLSLVEGYAEIVVPPLEAPSAPNVSVASVSSTGAVLSASLPVGATGEYSVNGAAPTPFASGPLSLVGLSPATAYSVSVRSIAAGLSSSATVVTFNTPSAGIGGGGGGGAGGGSTSTTTIAGPGVSRIVTKRWNGTSWQPATLGVCVGTAAWVPSGIKKT